MQKLNCSFFKAIIMTLRRSYIFGIIPCLLLVTFASGILFHPDVRKQSLAKENLPSPLGKYVAIQDLNLNLTAYETCDDENGKPIIILVYDIFGFHPHFQFIADRITQETGFCTVIPDFFHGNPFPRNKYPPANSRALTNFINRNGSWDKVVRKNFIQVLSHYKTKDFGVLGFCWGGKIATLSISDSETSKSVRVAGLIHPSLLTTKDSTKVQSPMIILPSKHEPNLVPFCSRINRRLGKGSCEHKRFNDMAHGFAGGLSDWTNLKIKARVNQSIELVGNFFNKKLNRE